MLLNTTHKVAIDAAVADVNAARADMIEQLAAKDAEIADLADFKSRAEQGIAAVVAVVQDDKIDAEATAQTILAIIAQGTAPDEERKRAEIRQQIAELEKQIQ